MAISRQIGWKQEEILYWEISKQLDRMVSMLSCCTTTTSTTEELTTTTTTTTTVESWDYVGELTAGNLFGILNGWTIVGGGTGSINPTPVQVSGYSEIDNITYFIIDGLLQIFKVGEGLKACNECEIGGTMYGPFSAAGTFICANPFVVGNTYTVKLR